MSMQDHKEVTATMVGAIVMLVLILFSLLGRAQNEKLNELRKQIDSIQKDSSKRDTATLFALAKDVQAIPDNPEQPNWNQTKFGKAEALAAVLNILYSNIDWSFDVNKGPQANIAPPSASGLSAGVSPNAIKDPVLRAEYLSQIAANEKYAQALDEQVHLRQEYESLGAFFRSYINQYFNSDERLHFIDFLDKDEAIKKNHNEILKLLEQQES